jgi:predicted DsbA family dithiol-disulfide isomerase
MWKRWITFSVNCWSDRLSSVCQVCYMNIKLLSKQTKQKKQKTRIRIITNKKDKNSNNNVVISKIIYSLNYYTLSENSELETIVENIYPK